MRTKVLLLSQQRLICETLAAAMAGIRAIEFLPPVRDTPSAIAAIFDYDPDVLLVDVNPSLFGIRVAQELKAACPTCRIIILASHADPIAHAQLRLAGVDSVLSKNIGFNELVRAIGQIHLGKSVSSEKATAPHGTVNSNSLESMTPRETQVLELVAQGLANKQIAAELGISIKTIEKHRQRVMCKLQAHETAGLTWRAICMGVARTSVTSSALPPPL